MHQAGKLALDSYQQVSAELIRARPGQTFKLRVISDSMWPLLRVDDVIVAQAIEAEAAQLSDVLVFQRGTEMVTHRLIARQADRLIVKGDNRRAVDELVEPDSVIGRVIALERSGRPIDLQQPRWARLNRSVGRLSGWQARIAAASKLAGRLSAVPIQLLIRGLFLFV